jgi:hypothetical protein
MPLANGIAGPCLHASILTKSISSSIASAELSSEKIIRQRKSHARKRPPGHIPRPPNAFILFRCDFVKAKRIPADVEHDHRNISRIAGKVWQDMSMKDKKPWIYRAEQIRRQHKLDHPAFYGEGARKRARLHTDTMSLSSYKTGRDKNSGRPDFPPPGPSMAEEGIHTLFPPFQTPLMLPFRRSSSCPPPGAAPISTESADSFPCIDGAKDDSSGRRPSCIVKYRLTNNFDIPILLTSDMFCAEPIQPLSWDQFNTHLNVKAGEFPGSVRHLHLINL